VENGCSLMKTWVFGAPTWIRG